MRLRMSEICQRIDDGEDMNSICTQEQFRDAIDDINYFSFAVEPTDHFDEEMFEL